VLGAAFKVLGAFRVAGSWFWAGYWVLGSGLSAAARGTPNPAPSTRNAPSTRHP